MNTKKMIKSAQNILNAVNEILGELSEETTATPEVEVDVDLDTLEDMKLADLKKIAEDAGIEFAKNAKKDALVEAIREFYSDDEEAEDEAETDEDEESEDEESLEDMSDEDLIALAEENDVEVPYSGKGKKKKLDREALIEALSELDGEEDEETDEEEDEDSEDEEEQDLEELDDEELVALAEELEVEPVYSGKGKKKKLDREATIEAIQEAQESDDDEEEDDDEDESEEEGVMIYNEEDLDELDEEELMSHLEELSELEEDYDYTMPKGWKKLKGKSKIKKAILEIYNAIEEE